MDIKMIDVSIIIVNFNTRKMTLDCIDLIKKHTLNLKYEIIVVDNASNDGSAESLRKRKDIIFVESKENGGFTKGNNMGIKKGKGKYILLLNSDIILQENSIKSMFDWMEDNKDVAVSGCKLLNTDKTIQSNGGYFPTLWKVFLWGTFLDDLPGVDNLGSYHPHSSFYKNQRTDIDWVTGAFFFIRREVLDKVGLLDERFFMYVEELELCYRIKKSGWKIAYTPITSAIHIGRASATSRNAILGEFRGLLLFYQLHSNIISLFILRLLLLKTALLRIFLFGLLGRKEAVKIYVEAITIN
jgi:GT2 family glycosyltransferase